MKIRALRGFNMPVRSSGGGYVLDNQEDELLSPTWRRFCEGVQRC
jgi:hypothetical protein